MEGPAMGKDAESVGGLPTRGQGARAPGGV